MAPVLANQERGPQGLDDPQRKVSGEPQGNYLPLQHLRNNESGSSYNRMYEGTNPQTGWSLWTTCKLSSSYPIYQSNNVPPGVMLCFATKGVCTSTISSMPPLAWNAVSTDAKVIIDPSAPPPPLDGEKPIASWNVNRSDSWTSSPHCPPSKRLSWMSSRMGKNEQQAEFVAVWTPSGHVMRRVRAEWDPGNDATRGARRKSFLKIIVNEVIQFSSS